MVAKGFNNMSKGCNIGEKGCKSGSQRVQKYVKGV